MKHLNTYITEYIIKKKLDKPIDSEDHCIYFPETKEELISNIKELFDKGKTDLNSIDTSKITDMTHLFESFNNIENVNFDVSKWDVSNVESMLGLFFNCKKFDCDLSKWDVSNVEKMSDIFSGCKKFKGKGLENWDISNVKGMNYMFDGCTSLKNKPSWYIRNETFKYIHNRIHYQEKA